MGINNFAVQSRLTLWLLAQFKSPSRKVFRRNPGNVLLSNSTVCTNISANVTLIAYLFTRYSFYCTVWVYLPVLWTQAEYWGLCGLWTNWDSDGDYNWTVSDDPCFNLWIWCWYGTGCDRVRGYTSNNFTWSCTS